MMDLELQFVLVFCLSLVFTVLYFWRESILQALFAMACWWIVGYYWLICEPAVYGLAYLFFLFGFIMFFLMLKHGIEMMDERRDPYHR